MKEDITVLFEDTNLVAVNKPSGIAVHGDGRTADETVADWVIAKYPEIKDVGEDMTGRGGATIERPGIVHRLDKDTSGVLLVAKNQKTYTYLKEQFQKRSIEKTYHAFVYGHPTQKEEVINLPIGRSRTDFRKKTTKGAREESLREAETYYKVMREFEHASYLEVYPKTGRMHQIRVHLAAIGCPVLCDALYAPKKVCPKLMGRLALHAHTIQVPMPDGSVLCVEANEPEDFQRFLAAGCPL